MTRAQIVTKLAEQTGLSKTQVDTAINALTELIVKEVKAGNKILIPNLGTFKRKDRKAREGINPKTMEKIKIPAKKVPKFLPAKTFKEAVTK